MFILDLNDEILTELCFKQLQKEAEKYKYSNDYFSCELVNNDIIIKDVTLNVYGNSCWEDSKEEREITCAKSFDESVIGDFFNNLLLSEFYIHEHLNEDENYIYFLDNYVPSYNFYSFLSEDLSREDEDYYYNYNEVRTLTIRVFEILEYLHKMPFKKELNKINEVFSNIPKDDLQSFLLLDKLENRLLEKHTNTKKPKL